MGRAEDLFKRVTESGELALDQFIEERQAEELFLDFKRSADNGGGKRLHDTDRQNLAKTISGFGNSDGGIVVWGVECSPRSPLGDVATTKIPIENPKRFLSWLEGAVSGCTLPAHPRVRHLAIESASRPGYGFVVTYIPKSHLAPHQCIQPRYYYIRAGSDFTPAPHGVIAGLFGHPPQPFVFHMWDIAPASLITNQPQGPYADFILPFRLASRGPGIARDLYVNVQLRPPKGRSHFALQPPISDDWAATHSLGTVTNLVSVDGFKLAPLAWVQVFRWFGQIAPPFESDLSYEISFGHGTSPVRQIIAKVTSEKLQEAYDRFVSSSQDPDAGRRFVTDVMAIGTADQIYPDVEPFDDPRRK